MAHAASPCSWCRSVPPGAQCSSCPCPAGDDDRQAVFFTDPVAGAADEVIAPLIGVIVLVVLKLTALKIRWL